MFSLEFYRWLHVVSLVMIFSGLVGLLGARFSGQPVSRSFERNMALVHGFGMLFMLIAGFGAMARLNYMNEWPWWIHVKLVAWLFMGVSMALAKRKAKWGAALLAVWLLVAGLGAYLGIFKPAFA